jgi:magnesium chelatase family protein
MATVVRSYAINGIDGYPVDIETKLMEGQPLISIIGLGDLAVKEAAERIQSAIDESGYVFPKKKVILSLAPGDTKKERLSF